MKYLEKLLTYVTANAIVLYIINLYGKDYLVFGRLEIGYWQALATTAFGIALAALIVDLFYEDFKVKLDPQKYIGAELLVNIGALYLLARTPIQNSVGVGISAFWVAAVVGFILSIAQYLVKKLTDVAK